MRLWRLHPRYLDGKGLVALWREALLAQKVLAGETVGYRHHPQLGPFKGEEDPMESIACYLRGIREEGRERGYNFDPDRIRPMHMGAVPKILVCESDIEDERTVLTEKLRTRRTMGREPLLLDGDSVDLHPSFVRFTEVVRTSRPPSLRAVGSGQC